MSRPDKNIFHIAKRKVVPWVFDIMCKRARPEVQISLQLLGELVECYKGLNIFWVIILFPH